MGDFDYFLKQIYIVLNSLHNSKMEFIICSNFNINNIAVNNKKTQLQDLLSTYNLTGTVHFPTRIMNISITSIDNIFVDARNTYTIKPYINGLSDYDNQLIKLKNLAQPINMNNVNNINKHTATEFLSLLSWEQ
jgi:hypothetical protein